MYRWSDLRVTEQNEEFVNAWKAWDEAPGAEYQAKRLIRAVAVFSEQNGNSVSHIRKSMSAGRRAGESYEEITERLNGESDGRSTNPLDVLPPG